MDKEKVLHLAKLVRIEIGDEEADSLAQEFGAILNYVGEIKGVTSPQPLSLPRRGEEGRGVFNVMREDEEPHESGVYTEKILEQAPQRESGYIKVKKIL